MLPLAALGTTEYLVLLCFGLCCIPLWLIPLIDALRVPDGVPFQHGDKTIWVLLIALTGWIGGILYYVMGKPKRGVPPPPTAPDSSWR